MKILLLLLIFCQPSLAEDTTSTKIEAASDFGTIVNEPTGSSTEYTIDGGTRAGNNLFHSFETFFLNKGKCTFNDENIQNTIARVVGPEPSLINGIIKSQARNFFFLNPNGIIFGGKAQLDTQGSFYASTAHYIRATDGETFDMNTPNSQLFTSSPQSFGFIEKGASIKIEEIDIKDKDLMRIRVSEGNTLGFIGGDFEMTDNRIGAKEYNSNVTTFISSISSPGEILMNGQYAKDNVDLKKGKVSIVNSEIDVSGAQSGNIYIYSGELFMIGDPNNDNVESKLESVTEDEFNGGKIMIESDTVTIENYAIHSGIYGFGFGMGDTDITGASLSIIASNEIVIKKCNITTSTTSLFDEDVPYVHAGNIFISGKSIDVMNNTRIESSSYMSGNAGKIEIKADENVQLFSSTIKSDTEGADAGIVNVSAENILFLNGSGINSTTKGHGNGGDISLIANNSIQFRGVHSEGNVSALESYTKELDGQAGNIKIETQYLIMSDGGKIVGSTMGPGHGGNMDINASQEIRIYGENIHSIAQYSPSSGLFSRSTYIDSVSEIDPGTGIDPVSGGDAGQIIVQTKQLSLFSKGKISTTSLGAGNAGNIDIKSDNISLDNQAFIESESLATKNGGAAGKINVKSNDSIMICNNSAFTTEAVNTISTDKSLNNGKIEIDTANQLILHNGKITTSVQGGSGHGGDIEIAAKDVVMNHSTIKANAYKGDGGNIHIVSDVFIQSQDSIVEASSEKGIDGIIEIESPDTDPSSGLITLSSDFLDASQWMKNSCGQRSSENISRLIVRGKDAVPTKPDDLHASPAITFKDLHLKQPDIADVITKAEVYFQKGDLVSAANIWYDAEQQINKQSNDYLTTVTYLIQTLQSLGFHQKALKLANKALPVAEKSQSSAERILFFNAYGDLLLSLNELPDAINYLKIALKHAKASKNPSMMASVMNNIANVVVVDGDVNTGIHIYDNALALLGTSDKKLLKAKIYLNLAYVISMLGTYEEAIMAFKDAFTFIQTLPNNHDKAFDYISLSQTGLMIDNFFPDKKSQSKICFDLLESAQAIGEKINDLKVISMASGHAAMILEKSEHYQKALKKTRYAIFTADQKKYKEIAYKWYWQAGRLFKQMGNEAQAIVSYKKSISILSGIREELFNGIRLKMDIFDIDVKPVYLGLAEIYLDQADRESNPQVKEQKILLARNVMERLKNAELSDYFEDECVGNKQKKQSNALTRTPEGVALLYPIALPDRLTILITLPDAIKHYNVDIGYKKLNTMVRSYRKYIQVRSSNQFLGVSQKLYQLLIHPVEKDLLAANVHTLLVAPDGVLRLVPFSSLHDNKTFLIEKYAIVTIPAVNLTDTKPSAYPKEKMETLVVGLSDAVQDFSALPSINEELRDIKKIMNGKKIYKNTDYTIANVQKEFKTNDYNIVHFATHGVFGGTGKNSFLLTYESQLDMNKLEDLMSLGKYRNHQVDMLTLSACQTALGNERAALGLAGVAVKAGVKSAVATLWYVDDQATSLAIRELYRQLKKDNMTKAKALQNAQKKLLAMHRYWHPIYWAPFLLIGSWI
jgi:filamentous hemagglutinin family protein